MGFKIHSGADVNVMSKISFKKIAQKEELCRADKILKGPGGSKLRCIGQFTTHVKYKDKHCQFKAYVVRGENMSDLLSCQSADEMGLVKWVHTVHSTGEFGLFKTQSLKTVLRENAQPHAVHTAFLS